MKKKFIIYSSLIVISVFLIVFGFILLDSSEDTLLEVDENRILNLCVDDELCEFVDINIYPIFTVNTDNEILLDKFYDINNQITESYKKNKDGMLNESCNDISSEINYMYEYDLNYNFYIDEDFLVFSYYALERDVCTREFSTDTPNVFIYSFETKDFVDQKNLLDKYNIKEEDILNSISTAVLSYNSVNDSNYSSEINDYLVYLDENEQVYVYYYIAEIDRYFDMLVVSF